jgi:hypothetical protein
MKIGRIGLVILNTFMLWGCVQQPAREAPLPPVATSGSPLKELMQRVMQAEADTYGKEYDQMKTAIAAVAKRVFSAHGLKKLTQDSTDFGNSFQRVRIDKGVFILTGHNYWWKLEPVTQNDEVKEVHVKASPICIE